MVAECHNWSNPTCGTAVTFTNLSIGNYRVEVKALVDFTSPPKCERTEEVTIGNAARMLTFDADREQGIVNLMWTDLITNEGDIYEIEKSADAVHFEPIADVISEEDSDAPKFFTRKDFTPFIGDNFYRLKLTAVSGEVIYSEIRKIHISDIDGLFVDHSAVGQELGSYSFAQETVHFCDGSNHNPVVEID